VVALEEIQRQTMYVARGEILVGQALDVDAGDKSWQRTYLTTYFFCVSV
jgi:hypothetical protein